MPMARPLVSFLMILAVGCGGHSSVKGTHDWLGSPKDVGAFQQTGQKLAETSFFEVRVTRLMIAVDQLKEKPAIPLTDDLARYFAGALYKSEKEKKPYLVRALFANYTGSHTLFWRDGQLLIRHDSLGNSFEPQFSPLVVNLPSEPKEIFIVVGGAK
jgi:hypothetical protein